MKTEIYSTKNIALIDEDLTLYSELEEQKDFHKQYVWKYFNNIDDFNQTFRENFINLMIFNEPRTGCNNIELLFKPFLDLSQNSIIVLSSNKDMKETNINYSERSKIIFIRKPIKFLFLMKVIREKFNSLKVSRVLNINIGSYLLKPFEKVLIDKFQQKILLTDTEVKILKILCSYEGRFVAKEIILDEVWGIKNSIETHTLETHIYRLRKKLLEKFNRNLSIKSKPGMYSLESNF